LAEFARLIEQTKPGEAPTTVAVDPVEAPSRVMISFKEALAMTGLSRNTLYSLIRENKIPGVRKIGGTWRFHRQMLLDWLACK